MIVLLIRLMMSALCAMVMGCASSRAEETSQRSPEMREPTYMASELIVKLKPKAGKVVDAALQKSRVPTHTGLAWFDRLTERYGVSAIEPVFSHQLDAEVLKQRFPERSRRAPANAKTPDLQYVYKLTLRQGAVIPQAAADYTTQPDVEYAQPNYIATIQ